MEEIMDEIIEQTIRKLGITRNYRGYKTLCVAVKLMLEDENRIHDMMEGVYRPTSEILKCSYPSVERNIRTVIHKAWLTNRPMLSKIADFPVTVPPTVTEFIDIISNHVRRTCRMRSSK